MNASDYFLYNVSITAFLLQRFFYSNANGFVPKPDVMASAFAPTLAISADTDPVKPGASPVHTGTTSADYAAASDAV